MEDTDIIKEQVNSYADGELLLAAGPASALTEHRALRGEEGGAAFNFRLSVMRDKPAKW